MRPRGVVGQYLKSARMALKDPAITGLCARAVRHLDRRPRTPQDLDATPPRNILVIRTDRIGDLLCCSPLIAALHRRWPAAKMTLVGGPLNRAVMSLLPYLERAPVEFTVNPARCARLADWLPRQGFDLAVNLRSELLSGALIAAKSGAPVRMVANPSRTLPAFNLVLGPHEPHHLRRYWAVASALGVDWPEQRPIVEIPAAAAAEADAYVASLDVPLGVPLAGVGIPNRTTARYRDRALPYPTQVALVRRLADAGMRVLLFGMGPQLLEAEAIAAAVPSARVAPPFHLAVAAGVYRHLDIFVSTFTGPLHLADGVGTPTVAIGETHMVADWKPLGPGHRCVASVHPSDIPLGDVLDAVSQVLTARLGKPWTFGGPSRGG